MAVTLLIFAIILQALAAQEDIKTLPPIIIHGNSSTNKTCPSTEERNSALLKIKSNVFNHLFNAKLVPECGEGIWYRVAYLNMTDSSQQCPSAWREYTSSGIRVCKRPFGGCPGTIYPVSHAYSKVCGRVIGYQYGSPDAFATAGIRGSTINQAYLDGISITHGNPRIHIGAMLWELLRMVVVLILTVPALTVINTHHHLLETITTMSQLIKVTAG